MRPGADRRRDANPDTGSATVLGIGLVLGVVTVLVLALGLVAVLVAGQQARTAADLGSLAAVGEVVQGVDPSGACAVAGQVVDQHRARLVACAWEPSGGAWPEVVVSVRRSVPATPWTVTARARAGTEPSRPTPRRARGRPPPA